MSASEKPPPGVAARSAAKILVVDDDPGMRETLVDLLVGAGHHVRDVETAAEAVRAIVDAEPDVILLHIHMPGLTGVDALPAIRAIALSVAVIMVSGNTDTDVAKGGLARGAFDYVVKAHRLRLPGAEPGGGAGREGAVAPEMTRPLFTAEG